MTRFVQCSCAIRVERAAAVAAAGRRAIADAATEDPSSGLTSADASAGGRAQRAQRVLHRRALIRAQTSAASNRIRASATLSAGAIRALIPFACPIATTVGALLRVCAIVRRTTPSVCAKPRPVIVTFLCQIMARRSMRLLRRSPFVSAISLSKASF